MRPAALLLLFTGSLPFSAQDLDSACAQQKLVIRLLSDLHFDPPSQSQATCLEVLDLFTRAADDKNIFFMQQDIERLHASAQKVPGSDAYCAAIAFSYRLFSARLAQLDSIAAAIEGNPLVLDGRDTINFVFQRKERQYCGSMAELHKRIEKRIKYEALQYLAAPQALTAFDNTLREEAGGLSTHKARTRSLQKFRRSIARYRQPRALLAHLSDCMSNALARRCDPHSNYLNAAEVSKYRKALSTHEKSFGFTVSENKMGERVITELVPGGPAWKSNDLSENDVIAGLSLRDSDELPLAELDAQEINTQLETSSSDELTITVIKKDLQLRTVTLPRENILSADNTLNSYVVTLNKTRIGFIPIPSFYLDQENDSRQGCANDVAKEIIELKSDSVQGIILDLRYNGGGSMREAIALAGLFIDEGPVAIYKHKGEKPFLLKDLNRGTIWDGPLLVLINSASASASEFVTGALQDYNRAIVAGSESFGKGTAQNLVPADTTAGEEGIRRDELARGFLKVTAGKFYRLSARSHQGKGITPDITIPGVIEKVMERETSYPYALACDSVENGAGFVACRPLPKRKLVTRSNQRMEKNPRFLKITALGDSLHAVSKLTEKVPLSLHGYRLYNERQKILNRQMESLFRGSDPRIAIRNNTANGYITAMSPFLKRSSEKTIAALEHDITFQEGIQIMSDMIELTPR